MSRKTRAIVVHGGAWATPKGELEAHRAGVKEAARAGWQVLARGGAATEAVIEAVTLMESDPAFNAGRGAVLNEKGEVELDAAVMRGRDLAAGAVACVQGVENMVRLAQTVMDETPHVLMVGPGATELAEKAGLTVLPPSSLIVEREKERWEAARQGKSRDVEDLPTVFAGPSDTVGAVACDRFGHVAAAGSTGGSSMKLPGRVGDTPLVGSGLYADDRLGAAAATGWGEGIIRVVLSRRALEVLAGKGRTPVEAAREAIGFLYARTRGKGGIIVVDPNGRPGFSFNTPHMAHAYVTEGMSTPTVGI